MKYKMYVTQTWLAEIDAGSMDDACEIGADICNDIYMKHSQQAVDLLFIDESIEIEEAEA